MTKLTSIKFPVSSLIAKDNEGYNTSDEITWSVDSHPAKIRDATNTESVRANQMGYNIEKIFEVRYYDGGSILMDDADGVIYDIKRAYSPEHSWHILLECQQRQHGRGS